MYFPIAGIEVSPWIPPTVAFVISFFTSMGGISGAFLLLPFQISVLGFASPAVSPTNQLFNVFAIPSGIYRYMKEGRMIWPLTWIIVSGTLPGVLIGAVIRITYLPNPRSFKMFVGLVLLYIGYQSFKKILQKKDVASTEAKFEKWVRRLYRTHDEIEKAPLPRVSFMEFSLHHIVFEFCGQTFRLSSLLIFLLCFIVGIIGGIYGIGGGAIIAPFLVSFFDLPVYIIAGATLMGTFVTSIAGVLFYQILALFYPSVSIAPDWMLGFLFGAGGFLGMYFGARTQKFVSATFIKWIILICIFFISFKYISEFVIRV